MAEDLSDYPAWLRDAPVYGADEVAAEIQQKHTGAAYGVAVAPPAGGGGDDDAAVQAALAANAQVAQSSVAPFSDEGQQRLKKQEEMSTVVDQLLGPAPNQGPHDPPVPYVGTQGLQDSEPQMEMGHIEHRTYDEDHATGYDVPPPSLIDEEDEIPEGHFLLRSGAGDIFLRPSGFQDEKHFIVLYFDPGVLGFRPGLGTRFTGAVDGIGSSSRTTYDLYYSGITFQLGDGGQNVLVFHKA